MPFKFIAFLFISLNALAADSYVYITSSSPAAVDTFKIENNKLVKIASLQLEAAPDTMAFSKDKKFLYVSANIKKPKKKKGKKEAPKSQYPNSSKSVIFTLAISPQGDLAIKNRIVSALQPRFMTPDTTEKYLLVTDYFAGKSSTLKLKGGLITGEIASSVDTEKFSHSIAISKDNKYAYAPHTGPNKVYQFKFDDTTGKLSKAGSSIGPVKNENRYHAPRHCTWHPTLPILYTSNEHSGGISAWKMSHDGFLKLFQTLSSLPEDFQGNSTAADIHITPDGKFAYVSNRGKGDATSKAGINTLACFAIDPTSGEMTTNGHFKTATRPRSFCITPNGKSIIAIGQSDNTIALHRLDSKSGKLELVDSVPLSGKPSWSLALEL